MSWKRIFAGLLLVGLTMGVANAQQTRIITGTVFEAVTSEAVPGATVIVKDTVIGAITEPDGSFTLTGVPVGDVVLQVSSASHQLSEITVPANQSAVRVELQLAQAEEIVITGRAPQIFRKNLANGASVVQGDALNEVPSQTISDAMQGKIAGANIQSNSGAPGGGIQLQLRGISTIQGRTTPLYVVDGVVVSDVAIASGMNVVTASAGGSSASNQDNAVNRIADINPADIENIEVLKGAAAAALYGSKASNGVVVITTKRGRVGKLSINVSQRFGLAQISNKFGSRVFESEDEVFETYCDPDRPRESCIALYHYEPGVTYDHEEQLTQSLLARDTSISISSGTQTTKYFASASVKEEPGIIKGTGYSKETARLAIDQDVGERVKLSFTTNVIHSNASRGLSNNDNAGVSPYMVFQATPSFFDMRPYPDDTYPENPFIPSGTNPLQTVVLMEDDEEVWRTITSLAANARLYSDPNHVLNLSGNLGIDRFQQRNDLFFPRELFFEDDDGLNGTLLNSTAENRNINTGLSLIHTYVPASSEWQMVTSAGTFFEESELNINRIFAEGLTAGVRAVDAASSVEIPQTQIKERDQSFFLQEEVLLLDERLTLLGAVLADRSSVNGDVDDFFFYPKASATYRIPTEQVPMLDLLRGRLAYGETGNKPPYGNKFTTLSTSNSLGTVDGTSGGIIGTNTAGNVELKPERQREIEGGIDITGFDGRLVVELTAYQRVISDLLLTQSTATSTGVAFQEGNFGSLRNRGVEFLLQATPVRTGGFQWLARTSLSVNRSQITELDVPEFVPPSAGFGLGLGTFCIEKGQSATQVVGTIGGAEQMLEDDHCGGAQLGNSEPDFRVSFVHDFSYGGVTLHTLLDWQQGSKVINLTELLYDLSLNSPDYEDAGMQRIADWAGGDTFNASPYVQDGSFLKLREVSVTYDVPAEVLSQVSGVTSARLSLSARNLLTVTPYSGLDPEVSNFGRQSVGRNIDVAPYPPSRSVWLSVEAGF
jgi:TonB-linked SusC/RagA family outer membrane protein